MVESSKRLPAWRTLVTDEAWAARAGTPAILGPVRLVVTFGFRRPKSHFRRDGSLMPAAPAYPTGRNIGDLSKHIRAVEDALTDAGVWHDDDQVVGIVSDKEWWDDAGAEISVVSLAEPVS
jgi:crossover junction endodeoxyribonuclease RusA